MGARRDQIVLGVVAAAVLLVIVAFAATGSGVNGTATPTPVPPGPTPTPGNERDLFGGSLEPGIRYRTRAFIPALSFEVADTEWLVQDASASNVLILDRRRRTRQPGSERPPRAFVVFSRVTDIYDPKTGRVEPAPADLLAWMRRHPDLRVGHAEPTTVAGVPGESFHVAVRFRRPAVSAPDCRRFGTVCTAINPQRFFFDGTGMRTIVLQTEPDPLVIDLIGDSRAIEGPAAPVLRSLRIGVR